ncbi:MAG: hypothetical protein NXI19_21605 [Alphaproteobacteria bacterium]|nr:hypothetical protein [Alphaproteobacteria bacterium]
MIIAEPYPLTDLDYAIENVMINEVPYATWVATEQSVAYDQPLIFTYDIVNLGTEAAAGGDHFNTGVVVVGATNLGIIPRHLNPGERRSVTLDPEINADDIGLRAFSITANLSRSVTQQGTPESDKSNNIFNGYITIVEPEGPSELGESFGLVWPENPLELVQDCQRRLKTGPLGRLETDPPAR